MISNLNFISGTPRSGSTLLSAVMNQNPAISAGSMASPLAHIYRAAELAMTRTNESAVFISDEQRQAVLKGLFTSYYKAIGGDGKVLLDNNRFWMARMTALSVLFPDFKMICCVRDIAWIMDSFERLRLRNPFEPSGIYNYANTGTVFNRLAHLQNGDGTVGWALNALREALSGENRNRILLVEYEDLCRTPTNTMKKIYLFLGLPKFEHDFDHVEHSAGEFDRGIGAPGLHDVSGKIEWKPRQTILPSRLFAQYEDDNFWRNVHHEAA